MAVLAAALAAGNLLAGRCERDVARAATAALISTAASVVTVTLPAHQFGSTVRRQAGILVDVHSVLLGNGCVSNISFLARGRMDNLVRDHG